MYYHNITYPDMNNGDGLRVVLWLSGCSHHCKGCQNPQTWNPNSGILFDDNAKDELYETLSEDYISGLTLSGGDPLHENNIYDLLTLLTTIRNKYPNKTIWLYSGYTWEELHPECLHKGITDECLLHNIRNNLVQLCDVLVDGEYIESQRDITLKWRGSSNQRVIDVQETLKQGRITLYCD